MQPRIIHLLTFLSVVLLLLQSCRKKEDVNTVQCDTIGWNPDSITYSTTVSVIIKRNCIRCHNNSVKKGWVNLQGYGHVKKYADNNKLLGTIAHLQGYKSMPRGEGATMLAQDEICKIKFWIDNGALDN
ncbi:MAG: hypothetical protein HY840_04910 [Bacteroidetes bacterium]|nr:hypothetical protein [Bacteroidota bacterium]